MEIVESEMNCDCSNMIHIQFLVTMNINNHLQTDHALTCMALKHQNQRYACAKCLQNVKQYFCWTGVLREACHVASDESNFYMNSTHLYEREN